MELIAVLVVMGVLAIVVMPRLWDNTFSEARFFDESITALRYAQRSALTMQRTVCVAFTGTTTITLTFDNAYGGTTCPGTNLPRPDGATQYVVAAPNGVGFTVAPTSFRFDRVGTPNVAQTLNVSGGGQQIVIEAVTGHVHN